MSMTIDEDLLQNINTSEWQMVKSTPQDNILRLLCKTAVNFNEMLVVMCILWNTLRILVCH